MHRIMPIGARQRERLHWSAPTVTVRLERSKGERFAWRRGSSVEGLNTVGAGPRLAAGPISWGVCEVPGWGLQLSPDRVFAEMAELGITATELGPLGWLPTDGRAARQVLDRHGLRLVGGFVPVVVHEADLAATREHARTAAEQLATAGGEVFVAAVVQDLDWSPPVPLDADGWRRAGEHLRELAALVAGTGLELVVHP